MSDPQAKIPQPKVVIARMALEKIRFFVNRDSQECSGMGITRVVGDTIYVDEVQMLEQKNSAAYTDINEDAVTKLMFEWRHKPGNINFWWHSHVNMGVNWSGTDEATIKQLAQHGMCVASVFNKRGEIRTAVACKIELPFTQGPQIVMFDGLPLVAQTQIPSELITEWEAEHTASVKKFTPTIVTNTTTPGGSSAGQNRSDGDALTFWEGKGDPGFPNRGAPWFRPCVTQTPYHWDSLEQGREFDTDWLDGSHHDQTVGKHTKSLRYRKQYQAWQHQTEARLRKETTTTGTTAVVGDSGGAGPDPSGFSDEEKQRLRSAGTRAKHHYFCLHDEINEYLEDEDKFELFNGVKIRASWYMSPGCEAFRKKTKEAFAQVLKLEQERLQLMGLKEAGMGDRDTQLELDEAEVRIQIQTEESAKELEQNLRQMEKDDAPNPNDLSEQDVEDLYARNTFGS